MGAHPTHRIRVKGDGRCAVRAALAGAAVPPPPGVADPATDTGPEAFRYIRDTRVAATRALVDRMQADEDVDNAVRWSFPDEHFETFDEWLDAQRSDDTESPNSELWKGGGQWMLYGLALLMRVQVFVHALDSETLTFLGPPSGTELVDARPRAESEDHARAEGVIRVAAMQNTLGEYDHFDVLLFDDSRANAEPLVRRPTVLARQPQPSVAHGKNTRLLAWAAFNVLAVALALALPPARELANANGVPGQREWLAHLAQIAHALTQQMSAQASQMLFLESAGASPIGVHAVPAAFPALPEIAVAI